MPDKAKPNGLMANLQRLAHSKSKKQLHQEESKWEKMCAVNARCCQCLYDMRTARAYEPKLVPWSPDQTALRFLQDFSLLEQQGVATCAALHAWSPRAEQLHEAGQRRFGGRIDDQCRLA